MIYSIQYMRAIAAILVVLHHSIIKLEQYGSNQVSWFGFGGIGVDLFFIISGYIMCHTVDGRYDFNSIKFLLARCKRILPIYWILTTLGLAVYILMPEKVNSSGGNTSVILSYFLFPTPDKYIIQNGWTLSYEFFFYFIFSITFFFKGFYRFFIPVYIILILVLIGVAFSNTYLYIISFVTNSLLIEFTYGIICFYLFKKYCLSGLWGLLLVVVSIFSIFYVDYFSWNLPRFLNYGIPALIFFIGFRMLEDVFKKNRSSVVLKLMKSIGDSSYSLYLFHPFSLVVASIALSMLGINDHGFTFVFTLVVFSIACGHLCYVYIEKRIGALLGR